MTPPRLSTALALLATLLGLLALLGWALDIAALKQGVASRVAMNPATAVCLALLGLEAVRMNALNAHAGLAKAGQLAILVVIAAGLAKLCDLVFGTSFAIDQMLFGAALDAEPRHPSRMAPNTAACLVLLGMAMLFMRGGTDARVRTAQLLAVLALLIGLPALVGSLFNVRELTGPLQYIPMAFNTAIAVCCIAVRILSLSPQKKGLMKFVRWVSIQTRVTLASIVIVVIGVWSLTFYSNSVLRDGLQRQLGAQQYSTASLLAKEIDQELGDRLSALETIAAEITPAMLGNTTVLQRLLQNRPIFTGLFNGGVMVLSGDGTALADVPSLAGRRGGNYMDNTDIAAAIKGAKSTFSRPVTGRVLNKPAFGITVPIRAAQGRAIGAMVGLINLGQLSFLDKILEHRYGSSGDFLLVAPKSRLIITASDKSRVMETLPARGISPTLGRFIEGYEGSAIFISPKGVEVLASVKGIPSTGWYLAAILPTEEAFAPIHALNQHQLLSALLLTLLAGAVTWWIMRRQLAPLFATVQTLATLTNTDQPMQPLPVERQDEIGELIGAFNSLLASLAKRSADLAESHARFDRAVRGTNDGIWEWIPATGEYYLSPRWKQLLGYEDHELPNVRETFFDRIHPEDKALVQRAAQAHLEERKPFDVELRLRCKSGEYRWFSSRGQAEWDEQGQPLRMAGAIADITERKRAEVSLREMTTQKIAEQAATLEAQRQSRLAALNLLEDARAARAQTEAAAAALAERNEQLSRFNRVAIDRELDMIGLKRQMNALARELGRAEPFNLAFADAPPAAPVPTGAAKDARPPAAEEKQ